MNADERAQVCAKMVKQLEFLISVHQSLFIVAESKLQFSTTKDPATLTISELMFKAKEMAYSEMKQLQQG
jgi:hypothetical protein